MVRKVISDYGVHPLLQPVGLLRHSSPVQKNCIMQFVYISGSIEYRTGWVNMICRCSMVSELQNNGICE